MTKREPESSTNCGEEVAVAFSTNIIAAEEPIRLESIAIEIHVATFAFDSQDEPVPLVVVTNLPTGNHSRLVIAPWLVGTIQRPRGIVPVKVLVFGVTKLAANVEADIKAGPIAFGQWRRRDLFHFFPTVRFCPRKRCCECAADEKYTH